MASTDAISAVCDAIAHILTTAMAEDGTRLGIAALQPSFRVYQSNDFSANAEKRIKSGASIFLYRVLPNLSHRTPSGNFSDSGARYHSKLPLDLHLLVTIWGDTPDTQNRLVGWVLRTLEDYPIIPPSILNQKRQTPAFEPCETVELLLGEMSGEEILQVWDTLGSGGVQYQITIPYLVRNLMIDSNRTTADGADVRSRVMDMQRMIEGAVAS